jgi:hypothetical protein
MRGISLMRVRGGRIVQAQFTQRAPGYNPLHKASVCLLAWTRSSPHEMAQIGIRQLLRRARNPGYEKRRAIAKAFVLSRSVFGCEQMERGKI